MMPSGLATRRPAVPGGSIPPLPPGAVLSAGGVRTYQGFAALTVWQPWAWAIAAGLKQVENRGWKPFSLRPGDVLGIHAALRPVDVHHLASVRENAVRAGRGLEVPSTFMHGALIAVATYVGVVTSREALSVDQRCWWVGPFGWVLRDVRPLPKPLEVRGQQGIWAVPGELVHQVWDQLGGRAA